MSTRVLASKTDTGHSNRQPFKLLPNAKTFPQCYSTRDWTTHIDSIEPCRRKDGCNNLCVCGEGRRARPSRWIPFVVHIRRACTFLHLDPIELKLALEGPKRAASCLREHHIFRRRLGKIRLKIFNHFIYEHSIAG